MKMSTFQFMNPEIEKINFIVNQSFDKEQVSMNTDIKTNCSLDKTKNKAKIILFISIGDESNDAPFYIELQISSMFKWREDVEDVKDLLRINGSMVLLSYARPIIANITGWSKYPHYNLPFINLNETEFEEEYEQL